MQQSFHVLDSGSEGKRANARCVAIKSDHVIAPGGSVLKHEDFAPAFGPQVEKLITRAAQEAGQIEVAGLKRILPDHSLSS